MPTEISSPFSPGQPVPVEFFVGRWDEIAELKNKAARATAGRLQIVFLTGERGIGKTSLARVVKVLVQEEYGMIGAHTFLGGVNSLEELVRRVFDRILKDSFDKPWHQKLLDLLGTRVKQVGLLGMVNVEFQASQDDLGAIVRDFPGALHGLMQHMTEEQKGIILVLDDVNGLSQSEEFANWLKSLTDEIATSEQPLPLCLLVVGLEERRQELIASQPSLARVFDLVEIRTWSDDETRQFYEKAFSSVEVSIEEDALDVLLRMSGGFPVMAHEIGDAAFRIDDDGTIDITDARSAVFEAAEIVGRKHLQPQVFKVIRSKRYRSILRKLVQLRLPVGGEFRRTEALQTLSEEEVKVFDNFIGRMKRIGVITSGAERGTYLFVNLLHQLYFWMEAERASQDN